MRVLLVVNDLQRGGAQRIVADIASRASSERFKILIAYFNPTEGKATLHGELRASGIELVCLAGRGGGFGNLLRLILLMQRMRPSLVCAFLPYTNILSRVAGVMTRIPVLSVQCNLPFTYPWSVRSLDFFTLPLSKAWVGASSGIEAAYGGSAETYTDGLWDAGRRHFTLYAGVDVESINSITSSIKREELRHELNLPEGVPVVLSVARLISWKGNDILLRAMVQVPRAHVLIVGWGPQESDLRNLARSLGIQDRVHFLGKRNDVYGLLGCADCYVQAHRSSGVHTWQGPNLSQMEACAAGVPSISTAVPRIEELIEDGVTGRVVPIDSPAELGVAIRACLEDFDGSLKMAKAARERVEFLFATHAMVQIYEKLFDRLGR